MYIRVSVTQLKRWWNFFFTPIGGSRPLKPLWLRPCMRSVTYAEDISLTARMRAYGPTCKCHFSRYCLLTVAEDILINGWVRREKFVVNSESLFPAEERSSFSQTPAEITDVLLSAFCTTPKTEDYSKLKTFFFLGVEQTTGWFVLDLFENIAFQRRSQGGSTYILVDIAVGTAVRTTSRQYRLSTELALSSTYI